MRLASGPVARAVSTDRSLTALTSQCHTTFDWNTGEIETGVVHNPHYYEFHRRNGTLQRNPGDVPCGGIPTVYQLISFGNDALGLHRLIQHIQHTRPRVEQDPNRKNRIEYMLGGLSDEQFKVS